MRMKMEASKLVILCLCTSVDMLILEQLNNGYLGDDSDIVNKRQVKISDHGLFYHDGPYVSHTQVQRMSPLYEDSYDNLVTKTPANPYTYAVTAVSVTPAMARYSTQPPYYSPSSYYQPSTPFPYYSPSTLSPDFAPSTPTPFHSPGSPLPSHSISTPAPYHMISYPSLRPYQKPTLHHNYLPSYDPSLGYPTTPPYNKQDLQTQVRSVTQKYQNEYSHKKPAITFFDSPNLHNPIHNYLTKSFPDKKVLADNYQENITDNSVDDNMKEYVTEQAVINTVAETLTNIKVEKKHLENKKVVPHQRKRKLLKQKNQRSQHKFFQLNSILPDIETNEIVQDKQVLSPQRELTINQAVAVHPIYQKTKSSALSRLLAIAGDDWDLQTGLEDDMVTPFTCPDTGGYYPDTGDCSVYYQCYQGTAHRNNCQAGLRWNTLTNMCDWEQNVDCSNNKGTNR